MIQTRLNFFLVFTFILCALLGCASGHERKASDLSNPDCSLQVQNSVSLQAIRYIGIMESIQDGNTNKAVEDMDWWVDQAIMELSHLEEKYPDKNLPEATVGGPAGIIKLKRVYKNIARYRDEHPRVHTVPLNEDQLKAIALFVKKYK